MQAHAEHAAASAYLPHGYCYLWNTPLVVTHVVSDLLIGIAYVAISISLAYLVHRLRKDIPFSKVFIAFGLFIVTCGFTHFIEVWTLWQPVYWFAGAMKGVTAAASVATAIAMPFTVPKVMSTVRDAGLSRKRELAAARSEALEEQNARLEEQARDLEAQRAAASALATELALVNTQLRRVLADAEREHARADSERARAEDESSRAEASAAEATEAKARAEEANRVKAEFLRTMSHELRTPLNAIGGYVELLDLGIRGHVTVEQREDFRRIRRAQQHLLAIITDILTFARIEAGTLKYRAEVVPVAALIEDVAALIRPQMAAKQQRLHVDLNDGPDAPAIFADREKAGQVVLNLLSNAHKYTPAGGEVHVTVRTEAAGVEIVVRDSGPGIPPERSEVIFEPFVQAVGGLSRPHEGTGLGLSISRELARAMGGDVTVLTSVSPGAWFVVRLPYAPSEQSASRA